MLRGPRQAATWGTLTYLPIIPAKPFVRPVIVTDSFMFWRDPGAWLTVVIQREARLSKDAS
jgi:hypothetical protein